MSANSETGRFLGCDQAQAFDHADTPDVSAVDVFVHRPRVLNSPCRLFMFDHVMFMCGG